MQRHGIFFARLQVYKGMTYAEASVQVLRDGILLESLAGLDDIATAAVAGSCTTQLLLKSCS